MTKRRLFLFLGFVALTGMVLGVLAILPPTPGVTRANLNRVNVGMTLAEVEKVFGVKGEEVVFCDSMGNIIDTPRKEFFWFAKDSSNANVSFVDNCVVEAKWLDIDESVLNKLRRWFHLK